MRLSDFEKVTQKHIDVCKSLIEHSGHCVDVSCKDCPFSANNTIEHKHCCLLGYSSTYLNPGEDDRKLIRSAKTFIELFDREL